MAIDPDNWLAVEHVMEEENHTLLQAYVIEVEQSPQPQLLLISSHATNGTSSAATFSLVITIGGIALVDSGSTDTFMDYSFGSQLNHPIITTTPKIAKVADGGPPGYQCYYDTSHIVTYSIQKETFTNDYTSEVMTSYLDVTR
jgi:hypothetical protein